MDEMTNGRTGDGAPLAEIEAVYRNRFGAFVRTAAAIVGDLESGRDVVQDAFAKAVQLRAGFRRDAAVEAWLWRIVLNAARSHRRGAGRVPAAEILAGPGNGAPADAEDRAVRALLASLPERQRLIVFLRYYADLDYSTIAEALEIRPGTVAAALHAAHEALRLSLTEVSP
jgi:RNA polymerase sigma factor (sigma-70 family)